MATKKLTKQGAQDRPMIRSSHGAAPRGPKRATAAKPARGEGEAAPRPRRAPAARARSEAEEARPKKTRAASSAEARPTAAAPRVPPGVSSASDEARETAIQIAIAALEKKASGLEVIDVSGRVDYADFLVLMSGRSDRHVAALSAAIEEALRKLRKRALAVEGLPHANWVLMDFGDVVVHVFQDDARAAYDIDGLWMDARRVPVLLDEPPART